MIISYTPTKMDSQSDLNQIYTSSNGFLPYTSMTKTGSSITNTIYKAASLYLKVNNSSASHAIPMNAYIVSFIWSITSTRYAAMGFIDGELSTARMDRVVNILILIVITLNR